jgi:acyl carrier protein
MTLTEQKLQTLIAARLHLDPTQVSLDQTLTADLGLDSFDLMEVILELDQAFPPLSLADEAVQNLQTLRQLAAYIDNQKST